MEINPHNARLKRTSWNLYVKSVINYYCPTVIGAMPFNSAFNSSIQGNFHLWTIFGSFGTGIVSFVWVSWDWAIFVIGIPKFLHKTIKIPCDELRASIWVIFNYYNKRSQVNYIRLKGFFSSKFPKKKINNVFQYTFSLT